MQRWGVERIVLTTVGLLLGIWQSSTALRMIFVFNNREAGSAAAWIGVCGGLLATFPCFLLSILKPRPAGTILFVASGLSLISTLSFLGVMAFMDFVAISGIPSLILGSLLLMIARRNEPTPMATSEELNEGNHST